MKSTLMKSLCALALVAAPVMTLQAQELKIGYVNLERVTRESNFAKAAQTKLETEFSRREKDIKDAEQKLRQAAEKVDKDSTLLAEADRSRRQRDLAEQERDLQRKKREYSEDLQQRRGEELQTLIERTNRIVKQIFDSEKYDLILQDASFVSNRVDITKKVIDQLNAQK